MGKNSNHEYFNLQFCCKCKHSLAVLKHIYLRIRGVHVYLMKRTFFIVERSIKKHFSYFLNIFTGQTNCLLFNLS